MKKFFKYSLFSSLLLMFTAVMSPSVTNAEIHTVEADGYSVLGDGENPEVVRERAITDAKRRAAEKFGVYVESISTENSGMMSKDEVVAISSQFFKVEHIEVVPEIIDQKTIRYRCHIRASADSDKVIDTITKNREETEKSTKLYQLYTDENENLRNENEQLKRRLLDTDNEHSKQEILNGLAENNNRFMANKYFEDARVYIFNGDLKNALVFYGKAINEGYPYANAYFQKGLIHYMYEDYEKAIADFEKASHLPQEANDNTIHAEIYYYLGAAYEQMAKNTGNIRKIDENLDMALNYYNISASSTYPVADSFLGLAKLCQNELHDNAKALKYLNKAESVASKEELCKVYVAFATYYVNVNNYTLAVNYLENALSVTEDNDLRRFSVYCQRGILYEDCIGNRLGAAKDYRSALLMAKEFDELEIFKMLRKEGSNNMLSSIDKLVGEVRGRYRKLKDSGY